MNSTATLEPSRASRGSSHSRQLLSAVECAEITGLAPVTIRRYMADGTIKGAVKIGSRWFVPAKAIAEEWGI